MGAGDTDLEGLGVYSVSKPRVVPPERLALALHLRRLYLQHELRATPARFVSDRFAEAHGKAGSLAGYRLVMVPVAWNILGTSFVS